MVAVRIHFVVCVDGVVVGHRTVSDWHRRVLGSDARGLVERSPEPVTVWRAA